MWRNFRMKFVIWIFLLYFGDECFNELRNALVFLCKIWIFLFNILLLLAILVVCVLDVSICCCFYLLVRMACWEEKALPNGNSKRVENLSFFSGEAIVSNQFSLNYFTEFSTQWQTFFFFIKFIQFERSGFAFLTKNEKYQQFCVCVILDKYLEVIFVLCFPLMLFLF